MSDDKRDNVVDLFKKSPNGKDSERGRFFKGVQYLKLTRDDNGLPFKEDMLLDYAQKCFYIVSVVRNNGIGVAIYKYKVPYASLLGFLNEFRKNQSYGKVIDIERYIPEDLA